MVDLMWGEYSCVAVNVKLFFTVFLPLDFCEAAGVDIKTSSLDEGYDDDWFAREGWVSAQLRRTPSDGPSSTNLPNLTSFLCPVWLIKGKPGSSQERVVPAVRLEPPTHIDCANSNSLLRGRCYAVLENACSSGIVQRNASARSRNTRIPYSPCASRIILNMLANPNCSSVATTTARRE
jgi:hypothetical protein